MNKRTLNHQHQITTFQKEGYYYYSLPLAHKPTWKITIQA